jgi:hypothetical protein
MVSFLERVVAEILVTVESIGFLRRGVKSEKGGLMVLYKLIIAVSMYQLLFEIVRLCGVSDLGSACIIPPGVDVSPMQAELTIKLFV